MTAIERWLKEEPNLYLLASVVYVAIGMGYVCTLHKDLLDVVSLVGCFCFSGMFLFFRSLVSKPHAHQEDTRMAAIRRRLDKKILKEFAKEQWYKAAKRCSFIAWILCGGFLFSYVGCITIMTSPWHMLLVVSAVLFVVAAVILVILSAKYIQLSEKELNQNNSGEEK